MPIDSTAEASSLEELLSRYDGKMQKLFLKVMNLHAGCQINDKTNAQLVGEVGSAVEAVWENAEKEAEGGGDDDDL